jgi:predicted nucleic acid-binding protein
MSFMIAFDTNILIYACDQADVRRQEVAQRLIAETTDAVLLWQVACEFVAATRKLAGQGFTTGEAWQRLAEYLELFPLVVPSRETLTRARHLHLDDQRAFWDALILAGCLEAGVARLYSEDLSGGRPTPGLEIVNPFA